MQCQNMVMYLLVEWPFEKSVTHPPHDHEKQRQMRPAARSVSIQIDAQTHPIAVFTGIECLKQETLHYIL